MFTSSGKGTEGKDPAFLTALRGLVDGQNAQTKDLKLDGQTILGLTRQLVAGQEDRKGIIGWAARNIDTVDNAIRTYQYMTEVIPGIKDALPIDTLVNAFSSTAATAASGASGIAGAGAAANTVAGADAAGNALGGSTGTSFGSIASYAAAAYGAYQTLSSDATDEQKAEALAMQAGLFVADIYTCGAASAAYSLLSRSETFRQFEADMRDYDGVRLSAASLGSIWHDGGDFKDHMNIATAGGFEVIANVLGIDVNHKSTKEYQAERAQAAFEAGTTDADKEWIKNAYEAKKNAAADNIIHDPTNPYDGKEWKWEEQKPLMKGEDAWGFMGFQEAFPDWISGYSEDQRRDIAQAALDENLLTPDKGNIIFSNSHKNEDGRTHLERIKDIAQQVKDGSYTRTEETKETAAAEATTSEKPSTENTGNTENATQATEG
ncbi:MAG: hypothetical protein KDD42_08790 [Bdellovibrionales bacterium]|nr:hypothetical protein [Bdellovibrionales bacterium]